MDYGAPAESAALPRCVAAAEKRSPWRSRRLRNRLVLTNKSDEQLMRITRLALCWALLAAVSATCPSPKRATPPTRDPHTRGYVTAKELPDGTVPSTDEDGNFIIGPTHKPAP